MKIYVAQMAIKILFNDNKLLCGLIIAVGK